MALRARLGQFAFDLSMGLVNASLAVPSHPWRRFVLRAAGVKLGHDATIARKVRLTIRGGVEIGDRVIVNDGVLLDGRGGLTIGSDTNISPGVQFHTADHDPRSPAFEGRERPIRVGPRAWLASGAVVLAGSTIGEGAIVGAGAVVHGTVEPWSIVAGNPARVVAQRPQTTQERLSPHRRFFH
jgi:putative colanic acid biosynthesis acetyltransferase WcaF